MFLETQGNWWVDNGLLYVSAKYVNDEEIDAEDREIEAYSLNVDKEMIQNGHIKIDGVLFEVAEGS